MSQFPVFKNHQEVVCFNCSKPLGDLPFKYSSYPVGRGSRVKTCSRCNTSTFYDLEGDQG